VTLFTTFRGQTIVFDKWDIMGHNYCDIERPRFPTLKTDVSTQVVI